MGRPLRYLVDSVILIDHFNGIDQATRFLLDHRSEVALSVITRAELLTGFEPETSAMVAGLLDRFPNLAIETPIADLAARLRRDFRWRLPDAFQAAIARYHALSLVTRNTRDFNPDRYDFVTVPYRLPPSS